MENPSYFSPRAERMQPIARYIIKVLALVLKDDSKMKR